MTAVGRAAQPEPRGGGADREGQRRARQASVPARAARGAGRAADQCSYRQGGQGLQEPGILNGNGWKPKGMHWNWNTFERLTAQHDAFVHVSLAGMAAKLILLGESLDDWI